MPDSTLVITPTSDEAENSRPIIRRTLDATDDHVHVLVVDDEDVHVVVGGVEGAADDRPAVLGLVGRGGDHEGAVGHRVLLFGVLPGSGTGSVVDEVGEDD